MHTVEALDSLILFRQKPDSLLRRLMATEEAVRVAAQGELVALAVENGWQGDLWRCCIARELVSSENPFSLAWERRSSGQDTLKALALADMKLFFELLNAPPGGRGVAAAAGLSPREPPYRRLRLVSGVQRGTGRRRFSGGAAGTPDGVLPDPGRRSAGHGAGVPGQKDRERRGAGLCGGPSPVRLADLVGYRQQKDLLIRNTEAFLRGKGSNNVLLYGDAGTRKIHQYSGPCQRICRSGIAAH